MKTPHQRRFVPEPQVTTGLLWPRLKHEPFCRRLLVGRYFLRLRRLSV